MLLHSSLGRRKMPGLPSLPPFGAGLGLVGPGCVSSLFPLRPPLQNPGQPVLKENASKKVQIMAIKLLKQQGLFIRQITCQSRLSRITVRKILRDEHPESFQALRRGSRLRPFRLCLRERFEQYALSATRLHEENRAMAYTGSASTVRRYVQRLYESARRHHKTTVRFETPPGKEAQADWAECGRVPISDGKSIAVLFQKELISMSQIYEANARDGMHELGLEVAEAELDKVAQQAAAELWSYSHYLGAMLEGELSDRHRRRWPST